jgi:tetratricopeptide (TPR) repeat protein
LANLYVELQDEFNRTIGYTRTSGSGYYEFRGFPQGTFRIKVSPLGTDYEEQEQEIEVLNIGRPGGGVGGAADELRDFYMRLRPGVDPASVAIYVQEVPSAAEKLYKKGISDLDSKRQDEGLEELRSAIQIFPTYYYALERLGTEYIKMGTPESMRAAAILLDSAVQVNPRGFKSWYGLAYAHYSMGSASAASTAIQKALEISATSPEGLLLSGVLLRNAKQFTEAEKQLVKARDNAKNTLPQIHKELGLLYGTDLKKYPEAVKELKQYLKARPDAKDADDLKKLIAEYEGKTQTT